MRGQGVCDRGKGLGRGNLRGSACRKRRQEGGSRGATCKRSMHRGQLFVVSLFREGLGGAAEDAGSKGGMPTVASKSREAARKVGSERNAGASRGVV